MLSLDESFHESNVETVSITIVFLVNQYRIELVFFLDIQHDWISFPHKRG